MQPAVLQRKLNLRRERFVRQVLHCGVQSCEALCFYSIAKHAEFVGYNFATFVLRVAIGKKQLELVDEARRRNTARIEDTSDAASLEERGVALLVEKDGQAEPRNAGDAPICSDTRCFCLLFLSRDGNKRVSERAQR